MKIVGFGDSFISPTREHWGYLNQVGSKLGADVVWNGFPGTSSWDAFFQFKDYPDDIDVAVFCWSDPSRMYHPNVRGICPNSAMQQHPPGQWDSEVWRASQEYYSYLYDWRKTEYEASAFYYWFDHWSERFANTKFIHMWSFAKTILGVGDPWQKYREDIRGLEYHHRWKNGVEIRPALMHFSLKEGWPTDNNLSNEKRANHMAPVFHSYLAEQIVDAINNYKPGKLYAPEL